VGKFCVDCGTDDRRVFHFDHLDPSTKTANVSELVYQSVSIAKIETEVNKCVIRCANCHIIRTGEQFGWRNSLWENSNLSGLDPEEVGA